MPTSTPSSSTPDDAKDSTLFNISGSPEKELGSNSSELELDADPVFERKTLRHIDLKILPLCAVLYALALIDRINLGAARTAGMGKDLHLEIGERFSIATCLYFVPYILLQVPGNAAIRRVGAQNWLTGCVVFWGLVQLGMAFVPTWGYLTLCRILLGACEAAFFPALVFLISTWYRRHEVQKRLAALYLMSITISGFSPIMAYLFALLDGKRGIAGWSWIFLIEGALTIFFGLAAFFFLPDFPDKNKFLTQEQTAFVLRRIQKDRGDAIPDEITLRKVLHHMSDWTLWAYGLMFGCSTLPAYALAYFISIILQGMGYGTAKALLLSAPPYGPAFVSAFIFAWWSDKTRHRAGFIVVQALITTVGLCLTAFHSNHAVRYFGTFLINAGCSGCIPAILAYGHNNVVSQSKRSVQSAITVAFGGVGGVIASTAFREQDYPRYLPGMGVTLGAQFLLIMLVAATTLHFRRLNRLAREGRVGPLEGQPGFFYTL